jgi:hypothetical protein
MVSLISTKSFAGASHANAQRARICRRSIDRQDPSRNRLGLMIDETRGLSLGMAAKEAEFTSEN